MDSGFAALIRRRMLKFVNIQEQPPREFGVAPALTEAVVVLTSFPRGILRDVGA